MNKIDFLKQILRKKRKLKCLNNKLLFLYYCFYSNTFIKQTIKIFSKTKLFLIKLS